MGAKPVLDPIFGKFLPYSGPFFLSWWLYYKPELGPYKDGRWNGQVWNQTMPIASSFYVVRTILVTQNGT